MKTTAAVLRGHDQPYTIESIDLRDLRPHEVLVRIVAAGMCHTDVLPRVPGFIAAPPIVAGHEGAGVVEAIGGDVTRVAVGDHVVLSFDSCGTCANCNAGQPAYCDTFIVRNLFGRELDGTNTATDADGAPVAARWFGQSSFASHAITTERNTVVVDKSLPLEKLGPLGCGIQTGAGSILGALDVQPGTSVAVFGAGAVGLAAVMAAKVAGATTIVAGAAVAALGGAGGCDTPLRYSCHRRAAVARCSAVGLPAWQRPSHCVFPPMRTRPWPLDRSTRTQGA